VSILLIWIVEVSDGKHLAPSSATC
jgi:hypothetical protein